MKKNKVFLRLLSNPAVIKKLYFPSISRIIPVSPSVFLHEWFVVSGVSFVFLVMIISLSVQINGQITELAKKHAMRQSILNEMTYWESVVKQYPDYRDAYYQLALLQYQVDEVENARKSVSQALRLDPGFLPGRAFQEKLQNE